MNIRRREHRYMGNAHNERVPQVEDQIMQGTARNANVVFRVYSKVNALFDRSKVRAFFTYCDLSAERH